MMVIMVMVIMVVMVVMLVMVVIVVMAVMVVMVVIFQPILDISFGTLWKTFLQIASTVNSEHGLICFSPQCFGKKSADCHNTAGSVSHKSFLKL